MNDKKDWRLLHEESWYRIPTTTNVPTIRNREVKYIAFFHTANFQEDLKWKIVKYASIKHIQEVTRQALFPNEPLTSTKAHKSYFKVDIDNLIELPNPIVSTKGRRILFIPTSEKKFFNATNINSIFNESPLEDMLYDTLSSYKIPAERQWQLKVAETEYRLDFAVFCQKGNINIECDGDAYHLSSEQVHNDKTRNDELTAHGWHVLRYDTKHLLKKSDWVENNLLRTVRSLGGYVSDLDDSIFYAPRKKDKGQGTLFD